MDARALARQIFDAAVKAVKPDALLERAIRYHDGELLVNEKPFQLTGRVFVIGAGKASGMMAQSTERILGEKIAGGLVVVKYGHAVPCNRIQIVEAGHPYPDQAGLEAAREIAGICASAAENDIVLCLLSGGGSALLADCPPEIELEDWTALTKLLVNSGASIGEINTVRKHLSLLKGGQLARAAWPARLICLALSDVVGDRPDVIASGPAVADPTTFAEALEVLRKYCLDKSVPEPVLRYLQRGSAGVIPETPKPGDPLLSRTTNMVIGSNRMALDAALLFAEGKGIRGRIVTDILEGDTADAAAFIVETARQESRAGIPKPFCLLFGGETTLHVHGPGAGGRNQHLALAAARLLHREDKITILAAGTDGTDGPTDAAGALVDGDTWAAVREKGVDPQHFLDSFDSFRFFQRYGGHVLTGPTMTNVMDIAVAVSG